MCMRMQHLDERAACTHVVMCMRMQHLDERAGSGPEEGRDEHAYQRLPPPIAVCQRQREPYEAQKDLQ